jgi:ATP-dependent RNA helicase RhlE
VPFSVDTYVHRVGRTGRAEATGHAVTLVGPEEIQGLRALEKALKLQLLDPAELEALANARNGAASHHGPQHHGGSRNGASRNGASEASTSHASEAQPVEEPVEVESGESELPQLNG